MLNVGSVSWNWSRNYTKWDIKHVRARNQRLPPPPARKIERNEWKTPAPACVSTTRVRVCVCIYSGRSPGRKKRLLWCGKNARAIALARGANRAQSGGNVATQGDHLRRDAQQRKLQQFRHIPSGSKRYLLEFYLKRTHTHTQILNLKHAGDIVISKRFVYIYTIKNIYKVNHLWATCKLWHTYWASIKH